MLRFLTAGESHGRALVVIVDGVPAGLTLDPEAIARDLRRRQGGYGRGRRMAIGVGRLSKRRCQFTDCSERRTTWAGSITTVAIATRPRPAPWRKSSWTGT